MRLYGERWLKPNEKELVESVSGTSAVTLK